MKTILLVCHTLSFHLLFSSTYFVSISGNDSDNGLSPNTAFRSIQKAADLAIAGDSILVANGFYSGFDFRNKSGSHAAPIIFKTLGTNCTINSKSPLRNDGINIENADHIIVDGFRVVGMESNGNGIRLVRAHFCVVRNCFSQANGRGIFTGFTDDIIIEHNICIDSYDEHGIYVSNSSDRPIIRYNTCARNNFIGIHMNGDANIISQTGDDGIISDALVYGNVIYDNNLAAGLNMDGCENPIIYNNIIYNNHSAQGIALFQIDGAIPTRGAKIFNNSIMVPDDGRWGILVKEGSNIDTEIYNNIIVNEHAFRGCIVVWDTADFSSDHNILYNKMSDSGDGSSITLNEWQALGLDIHSILVNDLSNVVENASSGNFIPTTTSVANNAGNNIVLSTLQMDILGISRPQQSTVDIGAYEFPKTTNCQSSVHLSNAQIAGNYFASQEIELIGNISTSNELIRFFSPEHIWNFPIEISTGAIVEIFNFGCVP